MRDFPSSSLPFSPETLHPLETCVLYTPNASPSCSEIYSLPEEYVDHGVVLVNFNPTRAMMYSSKFATATLVTATPKLDAGQECIVHDNIDLSEATT